MPAGQSQAQGELKAEIIALSPESVCLPGYFPYGRDSQRTCGPRWPSTVLRVGSDIPQELLDLFLYQGTTRAEETAKLWGFSP